MAPQILNLFIASCEIAVSEACWTYYPVVLTICTLAVTIYCYGDVLIYYLLQIFNNWLVIELDRGVKV